MNADHASDPHQVTDLVRMLPVPGERDLPPGRRNILKEHVMIEVHSGQEGRPAVRARLRRPTALALAGVLAGVLAVALASASLTALARHAGGPALGGHTGSGHGGQLTAARLLSQIATVAARPGAPGVRDSQYTYIASKEISASGSCTWSGRQGQSSGTMHCVQGVLGKPEKRQIWESVSNLCRPGLLREGGHNTKLIDKSAPCPDGGSLNDPTYRLLASLPTSPRALLARIYANERGRQEAFITIGDLLDESIAPPQVSAALYRAAALIPGVTVVPRATDAIGRPGIAVAFRTFGGRSEWIFDRKSLRWLGERDLSRTGTLQNATAVLARAFVNHPGQLPRHG